jgi:hypothetical protein
MQRNPRIFTDLKELVMAFGNFLFGSPSQTKQLSVLSQPQLSAQRVALGSGQDVLKNSPLSFAPQRAQYEKHFNEQIIPTLAERFAGNLSSGAFKGALGNTTSDFQAKLAALESQYNLGARQQGLRELGVGLQPEFQNLLQPRQAGLFENLASSLAGGAGLAGTSYLGGTGIGGLLSLLQQLFGGGQQQTEAQPISFQSQMQQGLQPSQGNAVGSEQLMNLLLQTLGGR